MNKNKITLIAMVTAVSVLFGTIGVAATEMIQVTTNRTNSVFADVSVIGNVIKVKGEAQGINKNLNLSYVVKTGDTLLAASQGITNADGSFSKTILLDTALYDATVTPNALLLMGGSDVNTLRTEITLFSTSDINDAVSGISAISSQSEYQTYISRFDDMLQITELNSSPATEYMTAQYELFVEEKPAGSLNDVEELAVWAQEFDQKANRTVSLMSELNVAAAEERWGNIESYITDTYKDLINVDFTKVAQVNNKEMFQRMCGISYSTRADIVTAYNQAYTDQLAKENNDENANSGTEIGGGIFAPSGGGGGGGNAKPETDESKDKQNDNVDDVEDTQKNQVIIPPAKFTDVENVGWAAEAINALRERGVVRGDGNGNFEPMRAVAREEILSMLMNAFRMPENSKNTTFTDVSENDWCYDVISQAQALGLVNGMPDGSFGKGKAVSRADLAVMAVRLVDIVGGELKVIKPAVVFEDYYKIPDYAMDMISLLQQAGVINGDDNGCFNPTNGATRAETAVVVYNLIKAIEEGK